MKVLFALNGQISQKVFTLVPDINVFCRGSGSKGAKVLHCLLGLFDQMFVRQLLLEESEEPCNAI